MVHLQISWWLIYNKWAPVKAPSSSQPPLSFASGPFTGTLDDKYMLGGVLVNHEAKLASRVAE